MMSDEHKKRACYVVIVLLLVTIGYLYFNSPSCGCTERMGPMYKNKERFGSSRPYEMGSYERFGSKRPYEQGSYERFNMDFTSEASTPTLQSVATADSPFIGMLPQ